MTPLRILASGALCFALIACSQGPTDLDALTNPAPCPQASVLFDASRVVEMNGEQALANVGFTGEIMGVRSLCEYEDGEPILSDLEIEFAFGRGQAATGDSHTYPYFVAVTRRDTAVIAKETFTVEAEFGDRNIAYDSSRIRRISIPRADDAISGETFEIVVGFELTQDQLAYNRSGVRFRQNTGAFETPSN
jgi:hypothetical protein